MVKIGLVSDTHDNLPAIDRAVEIFDREGVDLILHAGDWNAPFALARLARAKARIVGVFGNIDGDREALVKRAGEVGVELAGELAEVEVAGIKIAVIHGKDQRLVDALAGSRRYRVVVRGHTHRFEVGKVGEVLVVNPGEACGYLSGRRTLALLDPEALEVREVEF